MNVAIASLRRPKPSPVARSRPDDDSVMNFRVDLDSFRGPMDLLLYLVRKEEVEIVDLPIARITDQFLAYLELLEQLDIDRIGEFLEMASTLVELKSRLVLPHADEVEEPIEPAKDDLVRQLLEYKRFRDAASMLEDRARGWQEHFGRLSSDRATGPRDISDEPIHEVELWDLVSAFGRIARENQGTPQTNIVYDDTPIHVHMKRIAAQLNAHGPLALGDLFQANMHKSKLVGMFLAILELARHHSVRTEQNAIFGEIWVYPGESGQVSIADDAADEYDHPRVSQDEPGAGSAGASSAAEESATAVADAARGRIDSAHEGPGEPEGKKTRKTRARRPK
jgi:segregation and condensation protein A